MPNDINKLKRLMYAANHLKKANPVILKGRKITSSQALKYAWWFESFRAKLRSGIYRFSYFKKDGGIREAVGTLDPSLIPEEHHPKSLSAARSDSSEIYSSFRYYDLYANGNTGGWRSFCIDLFIGFVEEVKSV
jgi:hypothetical protein